MLCDSGNNQNMSAVLLVKCFFYQTDRDLSALNNSLSYYKTLHSNKFNSIIKNKAKDCLIKLTISEKY